jgi:hypothetical protein
MPKSKKSKTHFEQVPLEIVKSIVEETIPEANADEAIVETPKKKLSRIHGSRVSRG